MLCGFCREHWECAETSLPPDLYPVDVTIETDHIRACPNSEQINTVTPNPERHKHNWSKHMEELPECEKVLLRNIEFTASRNQLLIKTVTFR